MNNEELMVRYRKGETLRDIAKAADCKMMTISKRLTKLRPLIGYRQEPMSIAHPIRRYAALRHKLVTQLREQGVPTLEIAKRTGYSKNYVNQIEPPVHRKYDLLIQDIESQLAEGASQWATPNDGEGEAGACVVR